MLDRKSQRLKLQKTGFTWQAIKIDTQGVGREIAQKLGYTAPDALPCFGSIRFVLRMDYPVLAHLDIRSKNTAHC